MICAFPVHSRSALSRFSLLRRAHHSYARGPVLSAEDLSITRRLIDASKIPCIRVLEHVIVGRGQSEVFSLRESGMASFD